MRTVKNFKILFIILGLFLSGCKSVIIPNTEVCSVAGRISAGADCSDTLTNRTREMTLDELIDFLEPKDEVVEDGKVIVPAKAAAVIMSAEDFLKYKTAMDQACYILGKRCSMELQQAIAGMNKVIENAYKKK